MEESQMSLKDYLKELIGWYSLEEVHTCLEEICKEEFDFLKRLYSAKVQKTSQVQQPEVQQVQQVQQAQQVQLQQVQQSQKHTPLRADTKVVVVKQPEAQHEQSEPESQQPQSQQPQSQQPQSQQQVHNVSGLSDPKDIKKWQKEQEEKKKRELDAQGINPASLLTKENLERWILQEKKTYAAVARDYVGLPESMISSSAKSFNIQSETTKKRAALIAAKASHKK
jgi:hypothetical protein